MRPRSIVSCLTIRLGLPRLASRFGASQSQYVEMTATATKSATRTKKRRRIWGFTGGSPCGPVDVVRDDEQEPDEDEVGHDARTAVGDEGQRDPGQRDQPRDAADDDERLDRERRAEPDGEQLREAVCRHHRDP